MDLMVRRDIQQLGHDAQKVQRRLEILEHDHEVWARERQHYDLMRLIKHVKWLESDVCMMQADCMCMGIRYREDGTQLIFDSLHRAFATLNVLFEDLKQVRLQLNESYIHPTELKQLEIDWGRFKKTIKEIQGYLEYGEKSLKARNVIPLSRTASHLKAHLEV
jgi:hypothetical protein